MTSEAKPRATQRSKLSIETSSEPDETAIFQHRPGPSTTGSTGDKNVLNFQREWEPGCQPDEIYERVLPPYRAKLRRYLVERLKEETVWMADWHKRIRTLRRDKYFYWTALFGTHTFFMTFLPVFFFFGFPLKGRGMLHIVGFGVYISGFAKDLVCTPRPYSPPIIRLSMSTHHHEYGFPSSHSTNSVSIALFLGEWLYDLVDHIGWTSVVAGWALLAVYAGSVVGGRIYTGMHSIADVVGGSLMGVACWALWSILGTSSETWVNSGTWAVPATVIPLTLAIVHFHPEPVDDCPCFEDTIAMMSVLLGSYLGHWTSILYPELSPSFFATTSTALLDKGVLTCITITIYRLILGLGIMFGWRLVVKAILLRVLPPIFRLFSKVFDTALPTRRFYKAATDYGQVPPRQGFHPVPSVMDLHLSRFDVDSPSISPTLSPLPVEAETRQTPSPALLPMASNGNGLRHRTTKEKEISNGKPISSPYEYETKAARRRRDKEWRAKYDAEVLTKVGVYTGIGFLATTVIPAMFHWIEKSLYT